MAASVEAGKVSSCHAAGEFDEYLKLSEQPGKMVVVDFTASWCGPCRIIAPIFAELAAKYPQLIFVKVDVDELKAVAEKWEVTAMPTFIFFKGGELLHKIVGADRNELIRATEKLAGEVATASV